MASRITTLIDKQDSFEIVRDQVAQILADEGAQQMVIAGRDDTKDAEQWRLNVYRERNVPWDLTARVAGKDHAINVWFDSANVDEAAADPTNRQTFIGSINIDIVFAAVAEATQGGHIPGDRSAMLGANRLLRLCRNILMSDDYTYLRLRQIDNPMVSVGKRWVRSISTFQPQLDDKASQYTAGMRLELAVRYSEQSPQYEPVPLAAVTTSIQEDPDGRVLAVTEHNYTT